MIDGGLYGLLPNKLKKKNQTVINKNFKNTNQTKSSKNIKHFFDEFQKTTPGSIYASPDKKHQQSNLKADKSKSNFHQANNNSSRYNNSSSKNLNLNTNNSSSNFKLTGIGNIVLNSKQEKSNKEKQLEEIINKIQMKNRKKKPLNLHTDYNEAGHNNNNNNASSLDKSKQKNKKPQISFQQKRKESMSKVLESIIKRRTSNNNILGSDFKNNNKAILSGLLKDVNSTSHINSKNHSDLLSILGINLTTPLTPDTISLNPSYSNIYNNNTPNANFGDSNSLLNPYYLNQTGKHSKINSTSTYNNNNNNNNNNMFTNSSANTTIHSKSKSNILGNFGKNLLFNGIKKSLEGSNIHHNYTTSNNNNNNNKSKPSSPKETLAQNNTYLNLPEILKLIQSKNKDKKEENKKNNIISSKNEVEFKVNLKKNEYLIKFSNSNIQYNSDKEETERNQQTPITSKVIVNNTGKDNNNDLVENDNDMPNNNQNNTDFNSSIKDKKIKNKKSNIFSTYFALKGDSDDSAAKNDKNEYYYGGQGNNDRQLNTANNIINSALTGESNSKQKLKKTNSILKNKNSNSNNSNNFSNNNNNNPNNNDADTNNNAPFHSKFVIKNNKKFEHQTTTTDLLPSRISIKDKDLINNISKSRKKTIIYNQKNNLISQLKKIEEIIGKNKNLTNNEIKRALIEQEKEKERQREKDQQKQTEKNKSKLSNNTKKINVIDEEINMNSASNHNSSNEEILGKTQGTPVKFTQIYEEPIDSYNKSKLAKKVSFLNRGDLKVKKSSSENNNKKDNSNNNKELIRKSSTLNSQSSEETIEKISQLYNDESLLAKQKDKKESILNMNIFNERIIEEKYSTSKSNSFKSEFTKGSKSQKSNSKLNFISDLENKGKTDYQVKTITINKSPFSDSLNKKSNLSNKSKSNLSNTKDNNTTINDQNNNTWNLNKNPIEESTFKTTPLYNKQITENLENTTLKRIRKINFMENVKFNNNKERKSEFSRFAIMHKSSNNLRTSLMDNSSDNKNQDLGSELKAEVRQANFTRSNKSFMFATTKENKIFNRDLSLGKTSNIVPKSRRSLKELISIQNLKNNLSTPVKKSKLIPGAVQIVHDISIKKEDTESDDDDGGKEQNTDEEEENLKKYLKEKIVEIKFYNTDKMEFNEDVGIDMRLWTKKIFNDIVENIDDQTDIHEILKQQEISMSTNPVQRFKDYFKLIKKKFLKDFLKKDSIKEQGINFFTNKKQIEKIDDVNKKCNSEADVSESEESEFGDKRKETKARTKRLSKEDYLEKKQRQRFSKENLLKSSFDYFREISDKVLKHKEKKKLNYLNFLRQGMAKIYEDMLEQETFESKPIVFQLRTRIIVPISIKKHLLRSYLDIYGKIKNNFVSNNFLLDDLDNNNNDDERRKTATITLGLGAPTLFKHFGLANYDNDTSTPYFLTAVKGRSSKINKFNFIPQKISRSNFSDLRSQNFINCQILRDIENTEEFLESRENSTIDINNNLEQNKLTKQLSHIIEENDDPEVKEKGKDKDKESVFKFEDSHKKSFNHSKSGRFRFSVGDLQIVKNNNQGKKETDKAKYTELYKSENVRNTQTNDKSSNPLKARFNARTFIENTHAEDADEEELEEMMVDFKNKYKRSMMGTKMNTKYMYKNSIKDNKIENFSLLSNKYFKFYKKNHQKTNNKSALNKKKHIHDSQKRKHNNITFFDWRKKLFGIQNNINYETNEDDKINLRGRTNKESMISKTYQLQSEMVEKFAPLDKLRFYIRDDNYLKFKELFFKQDLRTSIEEKDLNGNSLLNLAVQCNATMISGFLIDEGSEVNTQNYKLNSPLHYALCHNNFKIANILIYKKADEDITNERGLTPWQYANINNI